jgi:hypothetical protein
MAQKLYFGLPLVVSQEQKKEAFSAKLLCFARLQGRELSIGVGLRDVTPGGYACRILMQGKRKPSEVRI